MNYAEFLKIIQRCFECAPDGRSLFYQSEILSLYKSKLLIPFAADIIVKQIPSESAKTSCPLFYFIFVSGDV